MGSGKTTVGRLVATRLGWPITDSDAAIEATDGRTVREIRDTLGTDAMHELEAAHLLGSLAASTPTVICPAASVVDEPACRAALADPSLLVAWLTARPETAAERFDDQAHRPRYGEDPVTFLAQQAASRGPHFREVADIELATDEATPDELASAIVQRAAAGG
jgi:shikimate kinase